MPEKPLRPCAKFGCKDLTRERYCSKHKRTDDKNESTYREQTKENRPNSRQRGYTKKWERYRADYLSRPENALCKLRLDRGCAIKAECIDHIIPHKGNYELFWDENNHQAACLRCNSIKGDKIL